MADKDFPALESRLLLLKDLEPEPADTDFADLIALVPFSNLLDLLLLLVATLSVTGDLVGTGVTGEPVSSSAVGASVTSSSAVGASVTGETVSGFFVG